MDQPTRRRPFLRTTLPALQVTCSRHIVFQKPHSPTERNSWMRYETEFEVMSSSSHRRRRRIDWGFRQI